MSFPDGAGAPTDGARDRYVSIDHLGAQQLTGGTYTDPACVLAERTSGRWTRRANRAEPAFRRSRLASTLTFDLHLAPPDRGPHSGQRRGGAVSTVSRYGEVQTGAGISCLTPTLGATSMTAEPGELHLVVLGMADVADYAAHMCGIDAGDLAFVGLTPLSPAVARHWQAAVAHVRDDILADPTFAASPVVVDNAFRTLVAAVLSLFANTALAAVSDPYARGAAGDVSAATLREVVGYLDESAGRSVEPRDVAEFADAPYREVAEGLRRRHGTHPAQLLWRARLRGAHRDLHAGDQETGDTVAAIAARWGFTDPTRFAVAYAMANGGESPSETLAR